MSPGLFVLMSDCGIESLELGLQFSLSSQESFVSLNLAVGLVCWSVVKQQRCSCKSCKLTGKFFLEYPVGYDEVVS